MLPRLISLVALSIISFSFSSFAEDQTQGGLGNPGKLISITFENHRTEAPLLLDGKDACRQLLVLGKYDSNQERDLTSQVTYEATPGGIVRVESNGLVYGIAEGEATIRAKIEDNLEASIKIQVDHLVKDVPVNFTNQVVPILTKFGCNGGGCHGKSGGQNGFALSLLGFEPQEDYEHLVLEARGRRLFPASPDNSLLLLKGSGNLPHGGGSLLKKDSAHYRILRRWIEQGSPFGNEKDPVVECIEVFPKQRLVDFNSTQQLSVIAHLSDGSTQDVTRMAQYESNQPDLVELSEFGEMKTNTNAGIASVMVRFQSFVDVSRTTTPRGAPMNQMPDVNNFVDELVLKQLNQLKLPPSPIANDATLIRRVTIDLAGRIPTLEEVEEYLSSTEKDKYEKLVDRLLASEDYADYFANKWSAILRNRRQNEKDDPTPTFAFHSWIREKIKNNEPYDQFVRGILTASGEEVKNPPVVWYREVNEMSLQLEDTAQLFLGQRIQCARCHHHPFEKWSQADYYGMAAFFSRVEINDPPPPKKNKKEKKAPPKPPLTVKHNNGQAEAINIKTGLPVKPTGLGAETFELSEQDDPRVKLVDWMVHKENPFFAQALANRYWKHFMGRGLVEPEDDMRITNPPSNPELLDALAKHFSKSNYDMKSLIRVICMSNVYRLSAVPNEFNVDDQQNFSRYIPRRLHAEVLLDGINSLTASKQSFKGTPSGTRAVQLPDNQFNSYFLSVFGRPDSSSACECERSADASLAQALHLFNSPEMLEKVNGERAKKLASDKRTDEEKICELYLMALSRKPNQQELDALLGHIAKKEKQKQEAYGDIIWSLVNTKEFLFNH